MYWPSVILRSLRSWVVSFVVACANRVEPGHAAVHVLSDSAHARARADTSPDGVVGRWCAAVVEFESGSRAPCLEPSGCSIEGHDHLLDVCLIALHTLLAPVHGLFHVLLAAGFVYAMYDRLRAITRMRQILSLLAAGTGSSHGNGLPCEMRDLMRAQCASLQVFPTPHSRRWWTPRVYVAREIESVLSHTELVAVLTHEAEHVRRRDPLRLSLLRFLGCTVLDSSVPAP